MEPAVGTAILASASDREKTVEISADGSDDLVLANAKGSRTKGIRETANPNTRGVCLRHSGGLATPVDFSFHRALRTGEVWRFGQRRRRIAAALRRNRR